MKILVAEDDRNILDGLVEVFEDEGYETITARDGRKALKLYETQQPDFVCLDVMMPGMSGYDVCKAIRVQSPDIPIIFISAKSEEVDKVVGLELGADDYIPKPFGVREVIARIRAVTRRTLARRKKEGDAGDTSAPFAFGSWEIIPDELRARQGDQTEDLSLRELRILKLLSDNPGKVIDRQTFFREAWGVGHIPNSRTLDQHISQLRRRLEPDPKNPIYIETVHGSGYRLKA
jgi:DNA-binding response OmpR family regulator